MTILSLVIPVYNEESTLEHLVNEVKKIETNDIKLELILVDDCSSDGSYEIAQKLAQQYSCIKVCKHEKNKGKGAALRTGFMEATGDYVGIQDADLEYNPQDYLKLIQPLLENKADVVYGSRYLKQDTRRILYFWHTFMNKGLTCLTNMYTNLDITDMETCYKLFRREVIQEIAPKLKENRFGFEPEVTVYVAQGKYRVYECAISYNPRTFEEGKKIGAKDGLRALYCILHYGAHTAPVPMQILLYLFIGGVSAVVNILSFMLMQNAGINLTVSVWSAFVLSAALNYILCILLLFRHKACWNTFGEILAYIATLAIMGGVDYACTCAFIALGMGMFWSKTLSTAIGLIGNFLLRKYFVFLERRI